MSDAHPTTRLIVVRHGETVWNAESRIQGQLDSDLSARGRRQAAALAVRVREFSPAALYSSDLGRALNTALAIGEQCGLTPIVDERLRERHLGVFQGKTRLELESQHATLWQKYKSHGPDFVVPSGESARQRHERTLQALREYAERHTGECVVIVGHGGTLNTAFRACTGLPLEGPKTFSQRNASLNLLEYRAGAFHLVTWGDVAHLQRVS